MALLDEKIYNKATVQVASLTPRNIADAARRVGVPQDTRFAIVPNPNPSMMVTTTTFSIQTAGSSPVWIEFSWTDA